MLPGWLDLRKGVPASYTVWMLMMLAALLALLLWVSVRDVAPPDPGPLTVVRSEADAERLVLRSVAGETLTEGHLVIQDPGGTRVVPFAEIDGGAWRAGQGVCVAGPGCLSDGPVEVRVYAEGRLLHEAVWRPAQG